MAWSISDLFPSWGDSGERPSTNFQYDGGDQVNEKHLDYLWSSVGSLEDDVRSALNDIDSDGDGVVDKADSGASNFSFDGAVTLGGDLSAVDGETIWSENNSHIPTIQLQADTDDDGLIEAFDETLIKDGGSREIDAAELSGANGSNGQFLTTDGSSASWALPENNDEYATFYSSGDNGDVTRSSNGTEPKYVTAQNYTIQSGVTRTVDNNEGSVFIQASNKITINGTLDATGTGQGGANGGQSGSEISNQTDADGEDGNDANAGRFIVGAGGSGVGGTSPTDGNGGDEGNANSNTTSPLKELYILTHPLYHTDLYTTQINAGGGGAGGGGGGSGFDKNATNGESGGDGGGFIVLAAPEIEINGNVISDGEDGGSGGDGSDGGDTGSVGGGGGGAGGGGGGVISLISEEIRNNGTLSVAGGSGGPGGLGGSNNSGTTADDGTAGTDGNNGIIVTHGDTL
jgi:hypothetical protein